MKIWNAIVWLMIGLFMPVRMIASGLYPVTLQEKARNSSLVIEGEVIGKSSFWNAAHTMIFTASKVKVYKVFAGTISTGYVQVLTQGGSVDNLNIQASELLTLEMGDIGTFFCYPNKMGLREPAGGELLMDIYSSMQGCYKYNTTKMSAAAPFDSYASITRDFYPKLTSITGRAFQNLQPAISFQSPVLSGASQNSVISFRPAVVNAGAYLQPDSSGFLTITGSGFGSPNGSGNISFANADNGGLGSPYTISDTSHYIVSWADNQVVTKVPSKAGTGVFQLTGSGGTIFSSGSPLTVTYSLSIAPIPRYANDPNPIILPMVLFNANGSGGYNVKYSTSTQGGGRNLNTAPEKAPLQRALATWKETVGANISEAGTTNTQTVAGDGVNLLVLDNTNTGVPPLPAGVLATTYSYAGVCSSGGTFPYPAIRTGFDVLIRNAGVSVGSVGFTLGPCPPASDSMDFETVILHELGHAIGLDHIIGLWEGNPALAPYANPPKIMNWAFPFGLKRTSPDYSALLAGTYEVKPKGISLGNCGSLTEMVPLATFLEPRDNCPAIFPSAPTLNNTNINFDLVHATSNQFVDPAYNNITCNASATAVTNTAFYAFKTGGGTGGLSIGVSNYVTVPGTQQACSNAGVQLALYRVNGCVSPQNYPAPFACRLFNASGNLDSITGLEKNASYLLMVNGLYNTKASFGLTFSGPVLPAGPAYVFVGNGLWTSASNWQNGQVPPAILPSGSEIIINPQAGGQCVLNTAQTISTGAYLAVNPNKSFVIQGSLTQQ